MGPDLQTKSKNNSAVPLADSVLTVASISKSYGKQCAVNNISFDVRRNEIVGLLGPNGAGKTTIINMILAILKPTSGTISIERRDISKERTAALNTTNFAATYAPLPGNLTVYQNLHFFGLIYGVKELPAAIEQLLQDFNLNKHKNTRCGVLSSGEQARVYLAKSLLNKPTLLLLDEPTASLDPATAEDLRKLILKHTKNGNGGVLWTSHNMHEVESVCDRVLFLSQGEILLEGDPKLLPQLHGKASLEELFIAVAREPLSLGTH